MLKIWRKTEGKSEKNVLNYTNTIKYYIVDISENY
jgi:hypothetical protein